MQCGRATRLLALGLTGFALLAAAQAPDSIVVGAFSSAVPGGAMPEGWEPLIFPRIGRHTTYTLVRDGKAGVVVRAEADASASGLSHKLDLPAVEWTRLSWRWKVERAITGSDVTRREGDDYPARIYVSFRYSPERLSPRERLRYAAARLLHGEYPPHASLNYIWYPKAPIGTTVANPFTDRVRMIVVENGNANLGRWLEYERDIAADYRAAFGEEPPPIAGVAIMTDADDTGESAVAYYGDVVLRKRRQ